MGAPSMKFLGIPGSLRQQSYNLGALRSLAPLVPSGIELEIADLAGLPFYSADLEQSGTPEGVKLFRARVAAADALIFAVPEYNFSVPGVLKNALEWLSRPPDPPADGKPCAVFGASVSPLGTARGQFHFRHIAVSLNMMMVNVPHVDITNAKTKFDTASRLVDPSALESLQKLVEELYALTMMRSGKAAIGPS